MLRGETRHAWRALRRDRRGSAFIVLMLGAGLGVNVALFTVINAAFLRPLPYEDPDRLVFLHAKYPGSVESDLANFSLPDFEDLRREAASFAGIAAQSDFSSVAVEGRDGVASVQPNFIDGPYFPLLGIAPAIGRAIEPDELRAGAAVTVISDGTWHGLFGGAPMIGRVIRINGEPVQVVGIMPRGFADVAEREGRRVDLWLPLRFAPRITSNFVPGNRSARLLWGIARLKPGVSPADAAREVGGIAARLERRYPETNRGFGLGAVPLRDVYFTDVRQPLRLLAGAALFVLLLVCCNVAVLLLARGVSRKREFAIKMALGAGRAHLLAQMLLEILLLALAAAGVSLVAAYAGTRVLLAYGSVSFPTFVRVRIDPTVLAVSIALAVVAAVLAGVLPAVAGWRRALKERLAGANSPQVASSSRSQPVLVVVQVAIAVALTAGAGLMVRSMLRLADAGLRFNHSRLLTAGVDLPASRYGDVARRAQFGTDLLEQLRGVAAVESATLWGPGTPGRATWVSFIAPAERSIQSQSDFRMVWRHSTNPGGLRALGIPLLQGRDFSGADTLATTPVAIVSRTVARETWPGLDPIGRRLRTGTAPSAPIVTIVGVAEDAWMRGRFRFDDGDPRRTPQRDIYYPFAQRPGSHVVLLVRGRADADDMGAVVRRALAQVDPAVAVYDARTMDDVLREEELSVRFAAMLMALYAGLALLLAASGLYGVLSLGVAARAREIGVRLALGARPGHVLRAMAAGGMRLTMAGLLLGLSAVIALSRIAGAFLYEVSPLDPMAIGGASALLLATAAVATLVPSRRAAGVDPLVVLRQE